MFPPHTVLSRLKTVHLAFLRPRPPYQFRRHFSLSPRPQAAENPDPFLTSIKNTAIFQKLADKPDALSALAHFAKVLQDQGIDVVSGKTPSPMQMIRLARNAEFREAAGRVVNELQNAGIKIDSQEALAELMKLRKEMSDR